MKHPLHSQFQSRRQSGIALVITLTLLAVVTAMAIIFLGVSRRERVSVKVTEDQGSARAMADAAVARAQAQAVATMIAKETTLGADLFVTTNFQSAFYIPGNTNRGNVSYVDKDNKLLTGLDYLASLTNLQFDPRPPVFVTPNENFPKNQEFRFYLDFNRNKRFETNGVVPVMSTNGNFYTTRALAGDYSTTSTLSSNTLRQRVVGDPEWIGVLERPDRPHPRPTASSAATPPSPCQPGRRST